MDGGHVVIVGGAILGSFCAWSLRDQGYTGKITVIEKDSSYQYCSTALSAACIRLQFATPLNIRMSLYGVAFLRNVKTHLGSEVEISYCEDGYLVLGAEDQVDASRSVIETAMAEGADVVALSPDEIKTRFPMIETDGIGIAGYGQSGEGWFDAYSLMRATQSAARAADVTYLEAEVTGFTSSGDSITSVALAGGQNILCDTCVLAAGAWSGTLAATIGIDLPVVPKKRTVFNFKAPVEGKGLPMIFDPSGFWMRPEHGKFIGGICPPADEDYDAMGDFEPHHHLMENAFWPALATRIPAMQDLRLINAWAGHYETNTLDQNGILGPHHALRNLIFATGFSGHGVMHAPAVGRGIAELITKGAYQTLDLSPLGWGRINDNRPMVETVVY